jgi:hypothetical protein
MIRIINGAQEAGSIGWALQEVNGLYQTPVVILWHEDYAAGILTSYEERRVVVARFVHATRKIAAEMTLRNVCHGTFQLYCTPDEIEVAHLWPLTSDNPKSQLVPSGKSVVYEVPGVCQENFCMSDQSSELVEISKLNGDFKKNYGKLLGAYLYLCSVKPRVADLTFGVAFYSRSFRP